MNVQKLANKQFHASMSAQNFARSAAPSAPTLHHGANGAGAMPTFCTAPHHTPRRGVVRGANGAGLRCAQSAEFARSHSRSAKHATFADSQEVRKW